MGPIRKKLAPKPCGTCQECCWALRLDEYESPAMMPCRFQGPHGCEVYNTSKRPPICKTFYCMWSLHIPGIPFRPDLSGVLVFHKGTEIVFRELRKGALEADWVYRALRMWPPEHILVEKWDMGPLNLIP